MSHHTTIGWLKIISGIIIVFGVIVAFAAAPAGAGPARFLIDLIFWPIDGAQSLAAPETRLLCAIGGGLMIGWGTMIWLLAARVYLRDPARVRTIFLASVGSWFIVDSLGSIAAGAPLNALFNIGFLPAFLIPLMSRAGNSGT